MIGVRILTTALALVLVTGCSEQECAVDLDCPTGQRCVGDECRACPNEVEQPYDDDSDDDCNPATPNEDLDRDGDNWVQSPVAPGLDCDDRDPRVRGTWDVEICEDGKDNNCDGRVDEPECADRRPPEIWFVVPQPNAFVDGNEPVVVEATDDFEVVEICLRAEGREPPIKCVEVNGSGRLSHLLQTSRFGDGPLVLQAVATDGVGRQAVASVRVVVDNDSEPEVMLTVAESAVSGEVCVAGRVDISVRASDSQGLRRLSLRVGDDVIETIDDRIEWTLDAGRVDGTEYVVEAKAEDWYRHTKTASVTLRVDTTSPALFVSPRDGTFLYPGRTEVLEVAAEDACGIQRIETSSPAYASNTGTVAVMVAAGDLIDDQLVVTATDRTLVDGAIGNTTTATLTFPTYTGTPIVSFPPGVVLIAGVLDPGDITPQHVVCRPETPDSIRAGLVNPQSAAIAPSGALVYISGADGVLRRYLDSGVQVADTGALTVPTQRLLIHPSVKGPSFPTSGLEPARFLLDPRDADGVTVWHAATPTTAEYRGPDEAFDGCAAGDPIALSEDGVFACRNPRVEGVVSLAAFTPLDVRARPGGGFWIVQRDERQRLARYAVSATETSTASPDAVYPPDPAGIRLLDAVKIDGEGNLYAEGFDETDDPPARVVVKLEAGAEIARVPYSMRDGPACKWDIGSRLVSASTFGD